VSVGLCTELNVIPLNLNSQGEQKGDDDGILENIRGSKAGYSHMHSETRPINL